MIHRRNHNPIYQLVAIIGCLTFSHMPNVFGTIDCKTAHRSNRDQNLSLGRIFSKNLDGNLDPQGPIYRVGEESLSGIAGEKSKVVSSFREPVDLGSVPTVSRHHFQIIQDDLRAGRIVEGKAYEEKLRNLMQNSKIQSLGAVGEGSTSPQYVQFQDGTLGIWKPFKFINNVNEVMILGSSEMMAYILDRFLGFNRVPTTVIRHLNGQKGTIQLMVGDLKKTEYQPYDPRELNLFDYLIWNGDRSGENYLRTSDGRWVAIDHGMAAKKSITSVINMPKGIDDAWRRYDATVDREANTTGSRLYAETIEYLSSVIGEEGPYTKLKLTTETQWRSLLGPHLNNGQIEAFLNRRNRVVDAVERVRTMFGDAIFKSSPMRER